MNASAATPTRSWSCGPSARPGAACASPTTWRPWRSNQQNKLRRREASSGRRTSGDASRPCGPQGSGPATRSVGVRGSRAPRCACDKAYGTRERPCTGHCMQIATIGLVRLSELWALLVWPRARLDNGSGEARFRSRGERRVACPGRDGPRDRSRSEGRGPRERAWVGLRHGAACPCASERNLRGH